MNRGLSLYLDVLRTLAALMVLVSHWAYPRFTGGDHLWIRQADLGGDGVVIFFVMSGLLIAMAAERRAHEGLNGFAADRLSRLWSVAVPAIALTFLLDPIGAAISPQVYHGGFYQSDAPLHRIAAALTFTNELWFNSVRPGSNGPWWSLGYEAMYYALFGAAVFLRGRARWVALGLIAAVVGPRVLVMLPVWLMGVWVWRKIRSDAFTLSTPVAWACALVPALGYPILLATGLAETFRLMPAYWFGADAILWLGFSDTVVWAHMLGAMLCTHILGVTALCKTGSLHAVSARTAQVIRWIAGGSFALYLFHYPLMQFAGAILPGGLGDPMRQAAVLLIPLLVAYALAELTERRRGPLRTYLRRRLGVEARPAELAQAPA